jgi:hypothetical protein
MTLLDVKFHYLNMTRQHKVSRTWSLCSRRAEFVNSTRNPCLLYLFYNSPVVTTIFSPLFRRPQTNQWSAWLHVTQHHVTSWQKHQWDGETWDTHSRVLSHYNGCSLAENGMGEETVVIIQIFAVLLNPFLFVCKDTLPVECLAMHLCNVSVRNLLL